MLFSEFKQNLKQEIKNTYVFSGEENFFKSRGIELIKKAVLNFPEMDYDVFDADIEPSKLVNVLRQVPFMNEKRLVVVKDFYPNETLLKTSGLKELIEGVSSGSVLVVTNSAKCAVLEKMKGVTFVDCKRANLSDICVYISQTLKREGLEISRADCESISEYCCGNLVKIDTEITKLAAYCLNKAVINEIDIEKCVHKDTEYQIYELVNKLAVKNIDDALLILNALLAGSEKPQIIFISIYNCFRRMLHISLSSLSDAQLAVELNVKEYAVRKNREQAAKFKKKNLKNCVDILTKMDLKLKKGELSADYLLFKSCFSLMLNS